jgi:hypothetical protein
MLNLLQQLACIGVEDSIITNALKQRIQWPLNDDQRIAINEREWRICHLCGRKFNIDSGENCNYHFDWEEQGKENYVIYREENVATEQRGTSSTTSTRLFPPPDFINPLVHSHAECATKIQERRQRYPIHQRNSFNSSCCGGLTQGRGCQQGLNVLLHLEATKRSCREAYDSRSVSHCFLYETLPTRNGTSRNVQQPVRKVCYLA